MIEISPLSISDALECNAALSKIGEGAHSMEEVAQNVVDYLYQHLGEPQSGQKACALVRFYKTHDFGQLPVPLRTVARNAVGGASLLPDTKCLTLLGTAGDRPRWNEHFHSIIRLFRC